MWKVDPAGCEVHRCGGGLDSAACRGWGPGRGGEGEGLWGRMLGAKRGKQWSYQSSPFPFMWQG